MYNNNSILNKYFRRFSCWSQLNTSPTSSLTPCDFLNKYIKDPCLVANENIVPIAPIVPIPPPPIPPLPPLPPMPPLPPLPPIPPGRIVIGRGIFAGVPQIGIFGALLDDIQLNTVLLEGVGIAHNDGNTNIMLSPNTTYDFSYRIEIRQTVVVPESFSALRIDLGVIATTIDRKFNVQPGIVVYMRAGSFTTDDEPIQSLDFVFENSDNVPFDLISTTLTLEAIQ